MGLVCISVTESAGVVSRPGTKASWLAAANAVYAASLNTGPTITGETRSGRASAPMAGTRASASLAMVLAGCRPASTAARASARSSAPGTGAAVATPDLMKRVAASA